MGVVKCKVAVELLRLAGYFLMMKTKSSIKRTRRGYVLRLTKLEFQALRGMVVEANADFDYEERLEFCRSGKREMDAITTVCHLVLE
jgi:hypothetical protein